MKSDSMDSTSPTVASTDSIERWLKAFNQGLILFVIMALACGFGLYLTGHLELRAPSIGQAEPPPLDRGGKVGPLDDAVDGLRKKHWWWMQWLD
jgi:hypothetical protein